MINHELKTRLAKSEIIKRKKNNIHGLAWGVKIVEAEVSDEGWVVVSEWDDGQQNTFWKWKHTIIIDRSFFDPCIFHMVLNFKRLFSTS